MKNFIIFQRMATYKPSFPPRKGPPLTARNILDEISKGLPGHEHEAYGAVLDWDTRFPYDHTLHPRNTGYEIIPHHMGEGYAVNCLVTEDPKLGEIYEEAEWILIRKDYARTKFWDSELVEQEACIIVDKHLSDRMLVTQFVYLVCLHCQTRFGVDGGMIGNVNKRSYRPYGPTLCQACFELSLPPLFLDHDAKETEIHGIMGYEEYRKEVTALSKKRKRPEEPEKEAPVAICVDEEEAPVMEAVDPFVDDGPSTHDEEQDEEEEEEDDEEDAVAEYKKGVRRSNAIAKKYRRSLRKSSRERV